MRGLLIGYGNMGHIHHHAIEAHGGEIAAIIDPAPRFLDNHAVAATFEDAGTIQPDFAVIASPTPEHLTHTAQVIERFATHGLLGILLEKPPVRTSEELERLEHLAQQFGNICIGEVEHYNPKLEQFSRYQGKPASISMQRSVNLEYFLRGAKPWFLDEAQSGGIVLDLMIHDINLLVAKFGLPKKISSISARKHYYEINDDVQVVLGYESFDAELRSSWVARGEKPISLSIEVHGSSGSLDLYCDNYVDKLDDTANPYVIQMGRFLGSLRYGKPPLPLQSYIDATRLALSIHDRLGLT